MIGAGSMGGMMALLCAEHGIEVHMFDPSADNVNHVLEQAKQAGLASRTFHQKDYESLCRALPSDSPKVFILSVPHGSVGDKTIDGLEPFLRAGDVILDASNEKWTSTERRQERLRPQGVHFVGMGVSGGYQAARHGPSISPGASSPEAWDAVWPLLTKLAAKDKTGRACTARLGVGGCGHYVKMVHNGIEHGMMTALCEVWGIMGRCFGWSHDEVAAVLERWNTDPDSPLRGNFLVEIGAQICRTRDPGDEARFVLDDIRDKVVQDVCEEEATGTWSVQEAARLHVAAPSIAVSHMFRVQSAHAGRREAAHKTFSEAGAAAAEPRASPAQAQTAEGKLRAAARLRDAAYASFLLCFVQGMHLIAAADDEHGWGLDYPAVMQLWRGGCIIQSDAIVDLLDGVYRSGGEADKHNLLAHPAIAGELGKATASFRELVVDAVRLDAYVPALSASLEYLKYSVSTDLPTSFQEAQLDFFGNHMYDLKSEGPGEPVMGKHHHEWRPARGLKEMEEAAQEEQQGNTK
ncbi:putative 6-phosphogluconate dehydrogenase [Diaporthe ampelina]|uniref:phosphogluconate dehydrogenase (NADP(+)-dependent, decarboxylating) n=1 Tax=Diaporthe ampelina TaxID=1214573 RepID=A0A0G2F9B7_9PEZI|nr:putative 6-phosphogluconate dehydrogenase [Diaporthe ampelina]